MKPLPSVIVLLAVLPFAALAADPSQNCGCACCKGKEVCCCHESDAAAAESKPPRDTKPAESARHPLKGVVVEVRAAKHALLVKHEAIPGYMMAMTMLFQTDEAALQAVKPGDAITATLVEEADGYRLENVQIVRN